MGIRNVAWTHEGGILKDVAIRLGQLVATVVVTWFVAERAGLGVEELRRLDLSTWTLDVLLLAASCATLLGGYFLSAWLWGRIVQGLGGRRMAATESVPLYMVANLGRYVPGKVWQIAALATMAARRGVPPATATAAAVLLQGVALASAFFVGLGALWALADGASWRWVVPGGVVAVIALGLAPPVFRTATGLWFRITNTDDPPALAVGDAVVWLVLGLANWLLYASAFWILVVGLGLDAAFFATASAFAAAYVLGYLAFFAPAGVGVREASLLALLSPQLGAGTAGAVAVIARVWTTGVEVVPAAAFWARGQLGAGPRASADTSAAPAIGAGEEDGGRG